MKATSIAICKPAQAIEKAEPQNVKLKKSNWRPQQHAPETRTPATIAQIAGTQPTVVVHLRQVMRIRPTRVVDHSMLQRRFT